jgi:hypothetical protein
VCRRAAATAHALWLPARSTCPAGYVTLYKGELMTEYGPVFVLFFVCLGAT